MLLGMWGVCERIYDFWLFYLRVAFPLQFQEKRDGTKVFERPRVSIILAATESVGYMHFPITGTVQGISFSESPSTWTYCGQP